MSKKPELIKALNVLLKNELTAINQYFLHARMLSHQGYEKLAAKVYEESIDEMKHADKLTQRILFLGGLPNLQDLGKLSIGETPEEMLKSDAEMEKRAAKDLKEAHAICDMDKDAVTQMLIEEIMQSEEEHAEWLRKQLELIENLGVQNYLQSQV